mmetsp:Transcript_12177/g.30636  ORF Transcript_12177/g.30636 Transcript_12177/m.30636 type:complete len:364 (-) Transcript_12177:1307-2398(-)
MPRNAVHRPNSVGMGPVSEFWDKAARSSCAMKPIVAGIVPEMRLPVRSRSRSSVRRPIEVGMAPVSERPVSTSDVHVDVAARHAWKMAVSAIVWAGGGGLGGEDGGGSDGGLGGGGGGGGGGIDGGVGGAGRPGTMAWQIATTAGGTGARKALVVGLLIAVSRHVSGSTPSLGGLASDSGIRPVSELPLTSSVRSSVMLPNSTGSEPVKLFSSSWHFCRLVRRPMVVGILPVSWLSSRRSSVNAMSWPISGMSPPLSVLSASESVTSLVRRAISEGMAPVSMQSSTLRTFSSVNIEISGGSMPTSGLVESSRCVSVAVHAMGTPPVIELWSMLIFLSAGHGSSGSSVPVSPLKESCSWLSMVM